VRRGLALAPPRCCRCRGSLCQLRCLLVQQALLVCQQRQQRRLVLLRHVLWAAAGAAFPAATAALLVLVLVLLVLLLVLSILLLLLHVVLRELRLLRLLRLLQVLKGGRPRVHALRCRCRLVALHEVGTAASRGQGAVHALLQRPPRAIKPAPPPCHLPTRTARAGHTTSATREPIGAQVV
jgi:hypothetical protein